MTLVVAIKVGEQLKTVEFRLRVLRAQGFKIWGFRVSGFGVPCVCRALRFSALAFKGSGFSESENRSLWGSA